MTFAATANCVVFQGATPVFVDVDPRSLLIDPDQVEAKITSRTKAVTAVDYSGHPADYDTLRTITGAHGIALLADACHSLGATYKQSSVGSLADLNMFSFHPVKHIATGEGGMVTTNNSQLAQRMRSFRNHGITTDLHQREKQGSWFYEMADLGYNYRITDFQCALGLSQLKRLSRFLEHRRKIAIKYNHAFSSVPVIEPLAVSLDICHAYHLYVIRVNFESLGSDRTTLFKTLRNKGIGVNVHYIPVHLHPYYRKTFGTGAGLCPQAEAAYESILSIPMFSAMTDEEVETVISAMLEATAKSSTEA
jgi:perosamine synthetase